MSLLDALKTYEPFATAKDLRTNLNIVVFEPFWDSENRFPVRITIHGRMKQSMVLDRKHIICASPFPQKEIIFDKYFK